MWFTKADQESEFVKFPLPNTARDIDLNSDGTQFATAHHDGIVRITRDARKGMSFGCNDSRSRRRSAIPRACTS